MTRARGRQSDSIDVDAPRTDLESPVLAPASPGDDILDEVLTPQKSALEACAWVDTPRPAAKAQGAIYRDEKGILRTASAARARVLDMPPPAPRMVEAPRMAYRHGITVEDGNRGGSRTPKIAEENVARFIDVLRWWASVNDQAQVVRRVPWKEISEFICMRKARTGPAPMNSEQLKERVKTVAASVGKRCEMNSETPMELVALFGDPVAPEWAGQFSWTEFPFDRKRFATPKKQSRVRVAASYEVHVEDECEVEFGSPGLASPPRHVLHS